MSEKFEDDGDDFMNPHYDEQPAVGDKKRAEVTRNLRKPCGRCGHPKAYHRVGFVDGVLKERTPCQHIGCECRSWRR
jgi:hypothetical protein